MQSLDPYVLPFGKIFRPHRVPTPLSYMGRFMLPGICKSSADGPEANPAGCSARPEFC